ncbi:MAG: hypothetical protein PHE79_11900 [Eubacteriales bacterium]|nr:hypothetical protein [Eubacteriales bacterium]
MIIHNKRGATLVEAALIFPLIIAGVMAVLYIIIGLYLSLSLQSSLQISARKECGESSETVYRIEESGEYPLTNVMIGLRPAIVMEAERKYRIRGLFNNEISRKEKGRSYIIDEAEIIRLFYCTKEVFQ